MKELTKKWLYFANQDLLVVENNISNQELKEVIVFHLQQVLEKTLKGYIQEVINITPPKTHNLFHLISESKLEFTESQLLLVEELNFSYTESRYPTSNELQDFLTKDKLTELFNGVKEIAKWIKMKL